MNAGKLISDENVLIGRAHWDVPVRVELRAYLRFGRRMDGRLRRLVARWTHVASPHAQGVPGPDFRFNTPSPPTQ